MTEWAKFRGGEAGSGDGAGECGAAKVPLWRRVRAYALLLVICAIPLGMAVGGGLLVRRAVRPGTAWEDGVYYLMLAGVLFAPLVLMVRSLVRTRIKTGRWTKTAEERAAARAKRAAARAAGVGAAGTCATGGCGAKKIPWTKFAVTWASCTAMDRERSGWERAAAWAVLAGNVLAMLGVAACGVICIGAAFDSSDSATAACLFVALGLAILVIPGLAVRRLIRAIAAGKVGATREEVEQMRAQRAAWRVREWQRPLRTKITMTVFALLLFGVWSLHAMKQAHRHDAWVTPAMYAPFVVYTIWVQFRRPKGKVQE